MSLAVHSVVCVALFMSAGFTLGREVRPVVYHVNLVELPLVEELAPEPEPEPETRPEAPKMPTELPDLAARKQETNDVDVEVPKRAEPRAINLEKPEPERRQRPEPPAEKPPVHPEETAPERPRGASTQVQSESPIFTEYAYYRVAMRNKIAAAWSPPRASAELACVVRFRIIRSGAVVSARVGQSSGLPFFDHTALRAVNAASPLPPLPADFPEDVVGVEFEFAYRP
jgi:TonB family protein